ncbi:TetR/AcrR family transcriptional regulator [Burkholderia cepacia]|uniref:TetR/AcrR family transcriptional regulator n=1 Tax=Burkholderia cepacia TaxID=292 RepID=UPI0020199623|nr:TetR/AcrR family transcriptional regulator [Burkholderia cepacia]UQO37820.1 TetR/AcrR family transcriptional regulator [Burkholderia cepacia]UQO52158.1 TetR/AcrR family transcriptional regulator [Burkholderia cepacia]UQP06305.1 TetR/AcrR family transcriptional regulator [Burkholderia cepacia]
MHGKAPAQETLYKNEDDPAVSGSAARGNRELRLAQIILAAQQAFQEDGYAGFGSRGVAGRVGITLGNLQYYFRTKEELLRTTLETYVRQIVKDHTAIARKLGVSPTRRCAELVERIFHDINETDLPRFLLELWAFAQHEPYAADLVEEMHTEYRSAFAKLLSEIHATPTDEPWQIRASILVVQMAGLVIANHFGKDSDKDFTEFVRLAKRVAKMIIGLPQQELEGDNVFQGSPARQAAGKTSPHIKMFGSEEHVKHALFELSTRQTAHDAPYYRPTVQGKRREIKINEIVSSAANLLAAEGYANFTLARVARELGIPPSALKNYFPTHDDLLRSTIGALTNAYLERYAEMGRPTGKPAMERLREIVDDAFEEVRDPRICQFEFELLALAQHSDVTLNLLRRLYSAYRAIYVDLVREIDASATARECHARARLIAAQMEGAIILMFGSRKQPPDVDRVFELMRAITIRIAHGNIVVNDPA